MHHHDAIIPLGKNTFFGGHEKYLYLRSFGDDREFFSKGFKGIKNFTRKIIFEICTAKALIYESLSKLALFKYSYINFF